MAPMLAFEYFTASKAPSNMFLAYKTEQTIFNLPDFQTVLSTHYIHGYLDLLKFRKYLYASPNVT